MKKCRQIVNILWYNIGTLFNISVSFKFIIILALFILTAILSNTVYIINDITYSLENNFATYLSAFLFFFIVLAIPLYVTFDINAIILTISQSYQQKKIKTSDVLKISLKKIGESLGIKNFLIFFSAFLFLLIVCNSLFLSFFLLFKTDIVFGSFFPFIYILLFIFILVYLRLRYIPYYSLLEKCNFNESIKKSLNLTKGTTIKDLIVFVSVQILQLIIILLLIFFGVSFIILIGNLSGLNFSSINSLNRIIELFIRFSLLFFFFVSVSINCVYTSFSFYFHKIRIKERIKPFKFKPNRRYKRNNKKIIKVSFAIIFISFISSIFSIQSLCNKPNAEVKNIDKKIELTAHRGASAFYPENTMSAFIGAKKLNADWIELDVQQTKDGKIIVMHDSNFKRIAGVDKSIWELSYDEIKNLDVGSFFDSKFNGERIQLLEDVIKFAKENNIKLNIELKLTGHEVNLEKKVVDIVNSFDFKDKCIIASQNYKSLEIVKKYDDRMTTVYVIGHLQGDILSYTYADHYSLESSNITSDLVDKIHKEGKKIYAWTLNKEEIISKMIELNVDNIITDNIVLAKERINMYQKSEIMTKYNQTLAKIFKYRA